MMGETASCRVPREPLISGATDEYESFGFDFSASSMCDEVIISDWSSVGFNWRMMEMIIKINMDCYWSKIYDNLEMKILNFDESIIIYNNLEIKILNIEGILIT